MAHQIDPADPDIQEQWIGTLSSSERIRYLEKSLAGDNNWDADRCEHRHLPGISEGTCPTEQSQSLPSRQ